MSKVIFIGGSGRCGTNILKDVLSKHPDLCSLPFEYRFIIDSGGVVDFYNSYQTWSPYMSQNKVFRFIRFLTNLAEKRDEEDLWYTEWELDKHIPGYSRIVSDLIRELTGFSYSGRSCIMPPMDHRMFVNPPFTKDLLREILGSFIDKIIRSILARHQASVFVDDNTWNILFAKELLELVPEGKIVHIIRDPRDVVTSMMSQRWCPSEAKEAALYYKWIMDRFWRIRPTLPRIEIKLEDLITDTESALKELCEMIEVEFDRSMLSCDLGSGNIGRWEKDLSEEQYEGIAQFVDPYVSAFGYEKGRK